MNTPTKEKPNINLLPSGKLIEELVSEDYYSQYGTNGDEKAKQDRIKGAKFIVNWLLNNG